MTATGHDQKTLSAIFGKPDLPAGENHDAYQLLLWKVEEWLQPENILDALRVREIHRRHLGIPALKAHE